MNKLIEAMVRTDVPSEEPDLNMDMMQQALQQIEDRFMDERTKGYIHPQTGQQIAPVSREEAAARWEKARSRFAQLLMQGRNKPDVARRLGLGDRPGGRAIGGGPLRLARSTYSDPEARGEAPPPEMDWQEYERGWNETPAERAAREEPSLRRGESRNDLFKRLIG